MSPTRGARVAALLAILGLARAASAEPALDATLVGGHTIWTRTRLGLAREDEAAARAEALLGRVIDARAAEGGRPDKRLTASLEQEAEKALRAGGAPRARSPATRYLHARILQDLARLDEAEPILRSLVAGEPGAPILGDAFADLGLVLGKRGDRAGEIEAYTNALAHVAPSPSRAILLANRAEAHMAVGQLGLAVDGYRDALAPLTQAELAVVGVTTLWGLAVALDRSGDPDQAVLQVLMARGYDPTDAHLRSDSWFFAPPWEEHWYGALGYLAIARQTTTPALRADTLAAARDEYLAYASRAGPKDPYRALAMARADRLDRELAGTFAGRAPAQRPSPR